MFKGVANFLVWLPASNSKLAETSSFSRAPFSQSAWLPTVWPWPKHVVCSGPSTTHSSCNPAYILMWCFNCWAFLSWILTLEDRISPNVAFKGSWLALKGALCIFRGTQSRWRWWWSCVLVPTSWCRVSRGMSPHLEILVSVERAGNQVHRRNFHNQVLEQDGCNSMVRATAISYAQEPLFLRCYESLCGEEGFKTEGYHKRDKEWGLLQAAASGKSLHWQAGQKYRLFCGRSMYCPIENLREHDPLHC